jgi:hypothetical protein
MLKTTFMSACASAILLTGLAGCQKPETPSAKGPAEQAGAKLDVATEKAREKLNEAGEVAGKALQKAGEKSAEALKKGGEKLENAAKDAQKKE